MDVKRHDLIPAYATVSPFEERQDGRYVTFADYDRLRKLYEAAWAECQHTRQLYALRGSSWFDTVGSGDGFATGLAEACSAHDEMRNGAGL